MLYTNLSIVFSFKVKMPVLKQCSVSLSDILKPLAMKEHQAQTTEGKKTAILVYLSNQAK